MSVATERSEGVARVASAVAKRPNPSMSDVDTATALGFPRIKSGVTTGLRMNKPRQERDTARIRCAAASLEVHQSWLRRAATNRRNAADHIVLG